MIVEYSYTNSILEFFFEPEEDDILEYTNKTNNRLIKLDKKKCKFILPDSLEEIHSDLLGLTVILLIYPFVGKNIKLPFPISKDFSSHFKKIDKNISPVDEYLDIRKVIDGKPSLAYSCGTDSTASLLLMPKNTEHVFLDRIIPLGTESNYFKDNIYRTLDMLIADEYKVTVIKTDLEYLREPKGFPLDLACSTPNILLADFLNIDSIAYGYCNHHNEFLNNPVDYICTGDNRYYINNEELDSNPNITSDGPFTIINKKKNLESKRLSKDTLFSFWQELFNICCLTINMNAMGISEVLTESIVYKSKYRDIIQSCMRDSIGCFCNECFKCFKRKLIRFIIENNNLTDDNLNEVFNDIEKEIKKPRYNKNLDTIHEIHKLNTVLLLACNFYRGDNKYMNNIKKHFSKFNSYSKYLLKWNEKSKNLMDEKYLDCFVENMKTFQ